MVFLSKVETAFAVPTGGCVVVPVALTDPSVRVKPGDAVQLGSPSGCLEAHVSAVEWLVRRSNQSRFGLLLSGDIECSQISTDAEIWIEQST